MASAKFRFYCVGYVRIFVSWPKEEVCQSVPGMPDELEQQIRDTF